MFTIEELLAKISNILETGSNANGYWIKFANGVMICWNTYAHATLGNTTNSNIGTYGWSFYNGGETVTYPVAFVSAPTVIGSSSGGASVIQSVTATTFSYNIYSHITASQTAHWLAIGRWK